MNELPKAAISLPLGFIKADESFVPVALQGLSPGSNLLVNSDGDWIGSYIPAIYRVFPFSLALDDIGRELVCIATDSVEEFRDQGLEAFFLENGELTPAVQEIVGFLGENSRSRKSAKQICTLLNKYELVVPWPLVMESKSGSQQMNGLFRIDEGKLAMLAADALCELRDNGAFAVIYCQLLSMQNIIALKSLLENSLASVKAAPNALNFDLLSDSGTLNFDGL